MTNQTAIEKLTESVDSYQGLIFFEYDVIEGCDPYGEEIDLKIFEPKFKNNISKSFTREYLDLVHEFYPANYDVDEFLSYMHNRYA